MDREKVIKTFKDRISDCSMIGYGFDVVINWKLADDILVLLKEQEAVEPFHRCIGKEFSLIEDSYFDYCPYCGKPITWEGR